MPISASHFEKHIEYLKENLKPPSPHEECIDTVYVHVNTHPIGQQIVYSVDCEIRKGTFKIVLPFGMFAFPPDVIFSTQEFQDAFMMHVTPIVGPLIPDAKWIFKEI